MDSFVPLVVLAGLCASLDVSEQSMDALCVSWIVGLESIRLHSLFVRGQYLKGGRGKRLSLFQGRIVRILTCLAFPRFVRGIFVRRFLLCSFLQLEDNAC